MKWAGVHRPSAPCPPPADMLLSALHSEHGSHGVQMFEQPDLSQPGKSEYFEIWEDKVCRTGHFPASHRGASCNEARGLGQGGWAVLVS